MLCVALAILVSHHLYQLTFQKSSEEQTERTPLMSGQMDDDCNAVMPPPLFSC